MWLVCIYCVFMCIVIYVPQCMCGGWWTNLGVGPCPPHCLRQGLLLLTPEFIRLAGWHQGSFYVHLWPHCRSTRATYYFILLLYGLWVFELRPSPLHSRHFALGTMSPALDTFHYPWLDHMTTVPMITKFSRLMNIGLSHTGSHGLFRAGQDVLRRKSGHTMNSRQQN